MAKNLPKDKKLKKGPQGHYSLLLQVSSSGKQAWMCGILWFKTKQNWTNGLHNTVKMFYVFVLAIYIYMVKCVCSFLYIYISVCVGGKDHPLFTAEQTDAHNCISWLISHETSVCERCKICVSCSFSLNCSNVPQGVPLCCFWHHVNISSCRPSEPDPCPLSQLQWHKSW